MSRRFACDLHIHSCLSPCADNDMTPNNIARMAALKELDFIALTDHNSCRNCAAAVEAGRRAGVLVLPGMELCTQEEIHVVCLFSEVSAAEGFAREIDRLMPPVKNRPDIFGEQLVLDADDEPAGTEPKLLLNAAQLPLEKAAALAGRFGGAAYPAHIDRQANGILGVLGCIPPTAGFRCAELSALCDEAAFRRQNPWAGGYRLMRGSDAHQLGAISERAFSLELPELSAEAAVEYIRSPVCL